ncbi:hypothetical protein [Micromonospora sp. NPDC004704]
MQDDSIRVRTGTLRGAADQVTATAYRLGHGLAGVTGPSGRPAPAAPGWAATTALAALESAVHDWLTDIGGRAAATADDRAAIRLTGGR